MAQHLITVAASTSAGDSTARWWLPVAPLKRLMAPAILLFPAVEGPIRQLESEGVIVDSWDASPSLIAAYLFTLGQRQATVRSLNRDLSISSRYQGGVRGEIDRIH